MRTVICVLNSELTRRCSKLSTGETIPGLSTVPDNGQSGTDADWKKWITGTSPGFNSVSHPIGTAAMMKRSLGGTFSSQCIVIHLQRITCIRRRG